MSKAGWFWSTHIKGWLHWPDTLTQVFSTLTNCSLSKKNCQEDPQMKSWQFSSMRSELSSTYQQFFLQLCFKLKIPRAKELKQSNWDHLWHYCGFTYCIPQGYRKCPLKQEYTITEYAINAHSGLYIKSKMSAHVDRSCGPTYLLQYHRVGRST